MTLSYRPPMDYHPTPSYQHYLWMVYANPPIALRPITETALAAGFKITHTENEDGYDMRAFRYGILAAKTEAAALWLQMNSPTNTKPTTSP